MRRNSALLFFVCLCVFNACGDGGDKLGALCSPERFISECVDENSYTFCAGNVILVNDCPDSQTCVAGACTDEKKACNPDTFVGACLGDNSYTACVNNEIVTMYCRGSQICAGGVCKNVSAAGKCIPGAYLSVCWDDTHKSVCSESLEIVPEACPAGSKCKEGVCLEDKACVSEGFVSECTDDAHYTVCRDNQIDTEICPSGTECQGGDCIAISEQTCVSEGFVSECTDGKHYTVCRDGVKDIAECEGDGICLGGSCTTETVCEKASFVSECQGMKQYTICTEEGKISSADCPVNTECKQGECREKISEVCDSETYINTCDGSKRIACDGGVIAEYDCAENGLVCHRGECRIAAKTECDRNHFVDKCIGDTLVYCSDDHLGVVSTDNCKKLYDNSGICTTVDGVPGCYRTCSDKEVQEHATSICEPGKSIYQVVDGECVQTADNQYIFVVPPNTEAIRCDTGETDICKDGGCVKDDRLGTACNPETDVNICDGDRLYYCDDNGRYKVRFCTGKCFAINDVTDCYEPCIKEGDYYYEEDDDTDNDKAIKFECTRTDSGLYYVPREAECFKIMDSTERTLGSKGFAYSGDICVNKKSESGVSSCDGNIAKNVVNIDVKDSNNERIPTPFEISTDCGSQTCVVQDGEAFCADSCTAEDVQNEQKKYQCDLYEIGQEELAYVSQSYSCVQVGDAYYWKHTGSESCLRGCAADQSCRLVHKFEGTSACYSYMDEIDYQCDDNIFLSCAYSSIASAYDCGDRVCSDRGRLGCFDTCDEADAGKMTHSCRDDNHSTHLVCTKSYGKYAMIDYTEECAHGCNAETGQCILESNAPATEIVCFLDDWNDYVCRPKCTAEEYDSFIGQCSGRSFTGWICNGYFWDYISSWACEYGCNDDNTSCQSAPDEVGKACTSADKSKCIGDIYLYCDSFGEHYVAKDCAAEGKKCVDNGDGASCVNDDPNACTKSEFDAASTKYICNDEYNELTQYQCKQSGENYVWVDVYNSIDCDHGCNTATNECIKLHADEGKSCSNTKGDENYYADRNKGKKHLACKSGRVVAKDCGTGSCHDNFGCYEPCDTIGKHKYACSKVYNGDEFLEYSFTDFVCAEDSVYHLKYYEIDDDDVCEYSCNEETGVCK